LAVGRLLGRERDHGLFDRRLDAVLQDQLALDLRQGALIFIARSRNTA
jgi:hypothetical protein